MRTILHLDVDAFFASVEQGCNPLLAGKPVVVGGLAHQRGCVHSASYEARRKGVAVGMSLREAKELCPDAWFLKGDFRHYRAVGLTIENILNGFSPDVEIASLDDSYVDLTHVKNHCRSPMDVAVAIQQRIRDRTNVTVSIGVASSKLIARIASGINKPAGITVVPHGVEGVFLQELPVRLLHGVGSKTERLLHELGITKIGQIRTVEKPVLIQLLGNAAGEAIWKYAHGFDIRPVQVRSVLRQISRETSFEEDTDDRQLVCGTFRYLSERITDKLRKENWTARQVRAKIRYADGRSERKSATLQERAYDTQSIWRKIEHIYKGFPQRRIRVKLVGAAVTDIECRDTQCSIFNELKQREELDKGIDNVRKRFGFTALTAGSSLMLQNYYRMEKHGYILHTPSLSQ